MKNRNLWIGLLALLLVVGIFLGIFFATRPETSAGEKAFTVTVVHADGQSRDFSYRTDEEYLGDALVSEGLIAGEEGAYGLYVKTVDGETADYDRDGAYWAFYVGDDYAQLSIDQTPVHDGDTFQLVYTAADAG